MASIWIVGLSRAEGSLARRAKGADRLVPLLLLASAGLLAAGLSLPVISVSRFFFFTQDSSILGAIAGLFEDGEYLLGATVGVFSVVFPVLKIGVADFVWRARHVDHASAGTGLRTLELLGKWSMLDVLVLALLVFSAKASGLADASSQPGLYLFFGAVITSMAGVMRLKSAYHRHRSLPAPS
jgi:paraquat-inducible protein A